MIIINNFLQINNGEYFIWRKIRNRIKELLTTSNVPMISLSSRSIQSGSFVLAIYKLLLHTHANINVLYKMNETHAYPAHFSGNVFENINRFVTTMLNSRNVETLWYNSLFYPLCYFHIGKTSKLNCKLCVLLQISLIVSWCKFLMPCII